MVALRKLLAVSIGVRALTNFAKPFLPASGFVMFGRLVRGVGTSVIAPIFGVAMLLYAAGLWSARPWARPVAVAYALWATTNVVLFPLLEGVPPRFAPWMYVLFAVPGIAAPWLAVWTLSRADRPR